MSLSVLARLSLIRRSIGFFFTDNTSELFTGAHQLTTLEMKEDTQMEKTHKTQESESVTKMSKNPTESQHFPSHLCQFNMMQAVKKRKRKKKVLHWFGVSLWMGGHHINNNNKNQTVIP